MKQYRRHSWQVYGRFWPYIWLIGYKIPACIPALAVTLFRLWPLFIALGFSGVRNSLLANRAFEVIIGFYLIGGTLFRWLIYSDSRINPLKKYCKKRLCVEGTYVSFYHTREIEVAGTKRKVETLQWGRIIEVDKNQGTYDILCDICGRVFTRRLSEITIEVNPFTWYQHKFRATGRAIELI